MVHQKWEITDYRELYQTNVFFRKTTMGYLSLMHFTGCCDRQSGPTYRKELLYPSATHSGAPCGPGVTLRSGSSSELLSVASESSWAGPMTCTWLARRWTSVEASWPWRAGVRPASAIPGKFECCGRGPRDAGSASFSRHPSLRVFSWWMKCWMVCCPRRALTRRCMSVARLTRVQCWETQRTLRSHTCFSACRLLGQSWESFSFTAGTVGPDLFSQLLSAPEGLSVKDSGKAGDITEGPCSHSHVSWKGSPGWNVETALKLGTRSSVEGGLAVIFGDLGSKEKKPQRVKEYLNTSSFSEVVSYSIKC